jgi:hypothetical protein
MSKVIEKKKTSMSQSGYRKPYFIYSILATGAPDMDYFYAICHLVSGLIQRVNYNSLLLNILVWKQLLKTFDVAALLLSGGQRWSI